MSLRTVLPLVFLLLLAGSPFARTDEGVTLSADMGWQRIEEKAGVTLYSRARLGTGIKEFKATAIIDERPAIVEKVLEDVGSYTNFMPYVTEARLISRVGNKSVTYTRLDVPFVANRDYTVRGENGTTAGPGGIISYRDLWQTANEAGPAERRGIVRVKVNEGSWLLSPYGPDGGSTLATYQIFTDSGGVIPAFLVNRGSQIVIPRIFEAIRKQAHDPKYGP